MKKRLDLLLVERGLETTWEKAKAVIMSGIVYVNNQKSDKAGNLVEESAVIEIRGNTLPYVSRGGLKLEKAMALWDIHLQGRICMDIGASTGGFTDCMLQNGAGRVYAVDVGYGQLDWKLRQDPRVTNMERTNIRHVTPEMVEPLDFASIDVAFISLKLVLPVAWQLLRPQGEVVALIKPQFEAGRGKVGKNGVVRDIQVHHEVMEQVLGFTRELGFSVQGLTYSPIKGPKGNIEYLMYLKKDGQGALAENIQPRQVVEDSHRELSAQE
ncbi:MAG: TlyA family RNA methyltransferase [Eubacteriales bacterium]